MQCSDTVLALSEPLVSARPAACFENYIQGAFLADQFPAQVAAAWIGNSMAVAMKHYLQVTEDHFKQAAQNAAQKSSEMSGNDRKEETQSKTDPVVSSGICGDLPEDSASFMSSNENVNGPYRTRTCDLTGVMTIGPDTGEICQTAMDQQLRTYQDDIRSRHPL